MKQPEGNIYGQYPYHVCKWHKSLYGLKQAPLQWYEEFDRFVTIIGLKLTASDQCVYVNRGKTIIVVLYIADGLVCRKRDSDSNLVIAKIKDTFRIKAAHLKITQESVLRGRRKEWNWHKKHLLPIH